MEYHGYGGMKPTTCKDYLGIWEIANNKQQYGIYSLGLTYVAISKEWWLGLGTYPKMAKLWELVKSYSSTCWKRKVDRSIEKTLHNSWSWPAEHCIWKWGRFERGHTLSWPWWPSGAPVRCFVENESQTIHGNDPKETVDRLLREVSLLPVEVWHLPHEASFLILPAWMYLPSRIMFELGRRFGS